MMMPPVTDTPEPHDLLDTTLQRYWWLRWEVALLVVLVLAIYFTRMTDLTIRGEESRRAQVGVEMIQSGNWVVPCQQGQPFYSRPPLQNWIIALVGLARGNVDAVAIRLPSVLAVLLTVLLIYGYSRTFLSPLGAFTAGAVFATMGQVLEIGRLGETEAVFTFLVSGSLLLWHWGYVQGWPAILTWSSAYLLIGFAVLAKGPQAPIYFATSVGAFLLLKGRWRYAFSWSHLVGIMVFLTVWSVWQIPYYLQMGWHGVRQIYGGDVALRFVDTSYGTIIKHLVSYPIEVLICLLPWSVLLIAYFNREFLRSISSARSHVLFLVCCIATTFPTVWLPPGSKGRYFMPLYPCFAVLIGLVVQRCFEAERVVEFRKLWSRYLFVLAMLMLVAGVVIFAATFFGDGSSKIGQPEWFAVLFLAASTVLAFVALWSRNAGTNVQRIAGVLSVVVFLGLTSTGVIMNSQMRKSEHTAEAVAELKRQLPNDVQLVSLGPIHHLFAYYYGRPIELLPMPNEGKQPGADVTYFCSMHEVSFPWEKIAAISCERTHRQNPQNVVFIGRRLH